METPQSFRYQLILVESHHDWKGRGSNDVTVIKTSEDEQSLKECLLPLTAQLLDNLRQEEVSDMLPEEITTYKSIYFQLTHRINKTQRTLLPSICCRYDDGGSSSWEYIIKKLESESNA